MNKLGIPQMAPMPAPPVRRTPSQHGAGDQRGDFDQALNQVLDQHSRRDGNERTENTPSSSVDDDRAEPAVENSRDRRRPERSDDDADPVPSTDAAAAADDGESVDETAAGDQTSEAEEVETDSDAPEATADDEESEAASDGETDLARLAEAEAVIAGAMPDDTMTEASPEPLLVFDLNGAATPTDAEATPIDGPSVSDPSTAVVEPTTADVAAAAEATVEAGAAVDLRPEAAAVAVAAETERRVGPSAVEATTASPGAAAAVTGGEAVQASADGSAETAAGVGSTPTATEGETMLELHGATGLDPAADADPDLASAPVVSAPAGPATEGEEGSSIDGAEPAADAPAGLTATDAAGSVDPALADSAPDGQVRPTQPTQATPPIGSTQATVETVASARTEATTAAANAQQLSGDLGDGIDAPEVWRQVQRAVGSLRTNTDGDQQMTIRLRPAELGSVMIRVIANETGTNVSVVAETSAAANQLNQQRQQLASELENGGLREVSVDIGAQTGDGDAAESGPDNDGDGDAPALNNGDRLARRGLADLRSPGRLRPGADRAQLIDLDL